MRKAPFFKLVMLISISGFSIVYSAQTPDTLAAIRNNLIYSIASAVYQNVRSDSMKASKDVLKICDHDSDGWISKPELELALKQDKAALSLRGSKDGLPNSQNIAGAVGKRLDRDDGRWDGYIEFNKSVSDVFEKSSPPFNTRKGIYTNDFISQLASGDLVIGRQIRSG